MRASLGKNLRLSKEIRELFPVFLVACLLVVVPFLVWGRLIGDFRFAAFALGSLLMAGHSFGAEFQHRTLPLLLAQPWPRRALWRDKMLGLGFGIMTVLGLVCFSRGTGGYKPFDELGFLLMAGLCAFCGAPYWTLVSRNGIAGAVFAAAAPGCLILWPALLCSWLEVRESILMGATVGVLLGYCAWAYWRGYELFMKLELVDGGAAELGLPPGVEDWLGRRLGVFSDRFQGPFANLLKKELRLQQFVFVMGAIFVALAISGAVACRFRTELGGVILAMDYSIYLLLVPLLVGAVSVGEEQGWGVADWHLTLPVSAARQWFAKFIVTSLVAILLGLALPGLTFLATAWLIEASGFRWGPVFQALPVVIGGQLFLVSLAVYAATLCHGTLRAMLLNLGLLLVLGASLGVGPVPFLTEQPQRFAGHDSRAPLVAVAAGAFGLACLLQWLAFRNFRRRGTPPHAMALQFLAFLLIFWCTAWVAVVSCLLAKQ